MPAPLLYRWTLHPGAEHCPACTALSGQVHAYNEYMAAGLWPKSPRLHCNGNCRCSLVPIEADEPIGDLWTVPVVIRAEPPKPKDKEDDTPKNEMSLLEVPLAGKKDGMSLLEVPLAGEKDKMSLLEVPLTGGKDEMSLQRNPAAGGAAAQETLRLTLQANGQVNEWGEFEVTAITAGNGNGWQFSADALRASLSLWDGASCFVDHAYFGHSLKDLCGVFYSPRWSDETQGVHLTLRPAGPSAALLKALGQEMLSEAEPKPRVGFSADVAFTAGADKKVKDILRVYSLDIVFDPARGGAFVRALNQAGGHIRQEAHAMPSNTPTPAATNTPPQAQDPTSENVQALRTILGVQQEQNRIAEAAEQAQRDRAQICAYMLDAGLMASRLPAAAQEHVRQQFAGRVFNPPELAGAIESARTLVSQLTGPATVAGPSGQIHGVYNTEDQLQAAVDDMLQAPRDDSLKALKVHKLTGIRELYHMLTGDYDYHGGFYPARIKLATTADFTGLVKNALNKIAVDQWAMLGRAGYDWWERIVTVEHFETLNTITGTLVGTVGTLPSVAEQGEYTELVIGDSPETAEFTKYGGYIPLTLELIDRDDTRKLRQYPRELANAGLRRISGLVAAIFTANAGVGPTMADGGALFNNTAVTTAGGHANLLTAALAADKWELVKAAVYDQPQLIKNATGYYGTGPKMAVDPRYLLVPRALQLTAMKIIYPSLENAASIYSENMQRGQPGDVITVPEWTDATDFAAVCDPRIAPAIYVGERFGLVPEIFVAGSELSPAVFMNDEHRLKVRQFVAVWVNDFRPLHKSNVSN